VSGLAQLPDLEARVTRKLQARILPFVMLLYFVSFLDRLNVGFAAFSMNKAIGLTPQMFGLGSGLFFIGYLLVQVPSNLLLLRTGARRWIACVVVVWGFVSLASAFVVGPLSFCIMRFLLGVAESGFFPGIIFYLSLWFPVRQRAVAIALFMAAAPLSSAIGSPISGALMELPTIAGLMNWQWLYIIESLPAILLGFVTLRVLTDSPAHATWLNEDERTWLQQTLAAEQAGDHSKEGGVATMWAVLCNPNVLALCLVYLGTSAGLYSVGFWSPLLIKQYGHSPLMVGWLNALPNVVAVIGMVLWARHSDATLERIWHVAIPCFIGGLGLIWAGYAQVTLAVILALVAANFGVNGTKGPIWSVPSQFLSGARAAVGIGVINSIGNLGGFLGPYVIGWFKTEWSSYAGGLDAIGAITALSGVVMLAIGRSLKRREQAAG
jgi:ACS family tartrate transporter-like MFS transporter